MTDKQYLKIIDKINKKYAKIERKWLEFPDSSMHLAILHDKNDELIKLAEYYYNR
jgi:hypothetical protein